MKLGEKMLVPKLETRKITYKNRMLNLENICGSLFIGVIDEDLNYETKIHISGYDHDQAIFMLPNDFIGKTVLIKYEKEVDREM